MADRRAEHDGVQMKNVRCAQTKSIYHSSFSEHIVVKNFRLRERRIRNRLQARFKHEAASSLRACFADRGAFGPIRCAVHKQILENRCFLLFRDHFPFEKKPNGKSPPSAIPARSCILLQKQQILQQALFFYSIKIFREKNRKPRFARISLCTAHLVVPILLRR